MCTFIILEPGLHPSRLQGCSAATLHLTLNPQSPTAQVALALADEQVDSACRAYEKMTAALNALYSEQKAMLSSTVEVRAQAMMTDQVS